MNDDNPPMLRRSEESDGELERMLVRNSFRSPPADWRGLILERALADRSVGEPTAEVDGGLAGTEFVMGSRRGGVRIDGAGAPVGTRSVGLWSLIRQKLASGWTVAAAVWALILGLNQYSMPRGESLALPKAPWSEKALAEIQAHQRLLADFSEGGASRRPVLRSGPAREQSRDQDQEQDARRPPALRPRAGQEIRETRYNV